MALVMAAGGALAMYGAIGLPQVELGITGSLVVLGGLVAGAAVLPLWAGAAVVGLLALFHGHAHGLELPEDASAALYAAGFVLSTAFLHIIGLGFGLLLGEGRGRPVARLSGAGVAAVGIVLLAAA